MFVYVAVLAVAGTVYVCGDFLDVDMSFWSHSKQSNVILQMLMVLLTLGLVPLSLRLFRFQHVRRSLQAHPVQSLLRWGVLRLSILGFLLIGNTSLYYLYGFESAFGYLAVMTLLTMPFVLPTKSRCVAETES